MKNPKNPNYENKVGKHPIPHAKGMAKDENRDLERPKKGDKNTKKKEEE